MARRADREQKNSGSAELNTSTFASPRSNSSTTVASASMSASPTPFRGGSRITACRTPARFSTVMAAGWLIE